MEENTVAANHLPDKTVVQSNHHHEDAKPNAGGQHVPVTKINVQITCDVIRK